jgi:hypothetical protein
VALSVSYIRSPVILNRQLPLSNLQSKPLLHMMRKQRRRQSYRCGAKLGRSVERPSPMNTEMSYSPFVNLTRVAQGRRVCITASSPRSATWSADSFLASLGIRSDAALLVFVLNGEASIAGLKLSTGSFASIPHGSRLTASPDCGLAIIADLDHSATADIPTQASSFGCPIWYNKYQAFVSSPQSTPSGSPLLSPWSFYLVHVPPRQDAIAQLHVHHDVMNIVFFLGPPSRVVATALRRHKRLLERTDIRGGECLVVHPWTEHNIVATAVDACSFIVINDGPSEYADSSASDYHNCGSCNIDDALTSRFSRSEGVLVIR